VERNAGGTERGLMGELLRFVRVRCRKARPGLFHRRFGRVAVVVDLAGR